MRKCQTTAEFIEDEKNFDPFSVIRHEIVSAIIDREQIGDIEEHLSVERLSHDSYRVTFSSATKAVAWTECQRLKSGKIRIDAWEAWHQSRGYFPRLIDAILWHEYGIAMPL